VIGPWEKTEGGVPAIFVDIVCGAESSLIIWPTKVGYPPKFFKPR
jgi:hypothetical protein